MALTSSTGPEDLLAAAFADGGSGGAHRLRWVDGSAVPLPVDRWLADATPEEQELLADLAGPVLDIGCGPGRHVAALEARGVEVLGIDVLPAALRAARGRGARVLERSVFDDDVPGAGRWATALLLDGNVGIGGDPVALMRRVGELLRQGGCAVVELEPPGVGLVRGNGRLETPLGRSSRFSWGRVGFDAVDELGRRAGFSVRDVDAAAGRWFARYAVERSDARTRRARRSG